MDPVFLQLKQLNCDRRHRHPHRHHCHDPIHRFHPMADLQAVLESLMDVERKIDFDDETKYMDSLIYVENLSKTMEKFYNEMFIFVLKFISY